MRIRLATSALVALGAASACALAGGLIHANATSSSSPSTSELLSSSWSVEASTDYGTTWNAPISSTGGQFPVQINTAQLRARAAYQPLTLRTTTGSFDSSIVTVGTGAIVEGDPIAASEVQVRAVNSQDGTCAAPAFERGSLSLPEKNSAPITLAGATASTPGAPQTVCLELSMNSESTAPDTTVALSWPITVSRKKS